MAKTDRFEVVRSGLIDRVADHGGDVVICAPLGYGKRTLVRQLCRTGLFRFALVSGTLEVVLERADDPDQLVTVIGGLGRLPPESSDELFIGHTDLGFSPSEVLSLARDFLGRSPATDSVAAVLAEQTAGWPLLVSMSLTSLAPLHQEDRLRDALRLGQANTVIARLVGPTLAPFTPDQLRMLATLASLGTFTEQHLALATDDETSDRCVSSDLLLCRNADRSLSLSPAAARTILGTPPDIAAARRLIPILTASGQGMRAVHLLAQAKDLDGAGELLLALHGAQTDAAPPIDLLSLTRMLRSPSPERARLGIIEARAMKALGMLGDARARLEEVRDAADDGPQRRRADAELLAVRAGTGSADSLILEIEAALASAESDEPETLATLLGAKALCLANHPNLNCVRESELCFLIATRQWESLGYPLEASRTLRVYASTTLGELARFDDVRAAMDRAQRLAGGDAGARLLCLVVALRAAATTGNLGEFSQLLAAAAPLAAASDAGWITGYLHWSEMLAAAWCGDGAGVARNHLLARKLLASLDDTRTSAMFLAESAEAHARTGQEPTARILLHEAAVHPLAHVRDPRFAYVALAVSDPHCDTEKVIHDVIDLGPLSALRRWRMLSDVLRAKRAAGRAISEMEMDELRSARDATGESERLEHFDADLLQLAPTPTWEVSIAILGGFRVHCSKLVLDISDGHITKLLKLLAARRGSAPADMVMEALWPDVDPELGRRRLKNVVRRTRDQIGQQSIIRTTNSITFGDNVRIDFVAFEQRTRAALIMSDRSAEWPIVAATALELYAGDLLPDDLYDDWADEARASARSQYDALLETAARVRH